MVPQSIVNHSATGILEIRWQDGTGQRLSNAFLRANCLCADCKTARHGEANALSPCDEVRVTGIIPVGAYAVQLLFSDGHARGIFPWRYLKSLVNEYKAHTS